MQAVLIDDHFAAWRAASLDALSRGLAPETIEWRVKQAPESPQTQALFDCLEVTDIAPSPARGVQVSKELAALLRDAALFRDPQRWAFLYKVLWRWQQGDRTVASPADVDGARLTRMAKSVRRAKHDMIAYVRFRKQTAAAHSPEYIAWYDPDHDVLGWAADHFAQRMGRSTWMIATPRGAAFWDGSELHLEQRRALPGEHRGKTVDDAEALWLAYYRSTFNPARLNEAALEQHMPVRFWKGLPEGHLIPAMISEAKSGAQRVAQAGGVGALGGKSIPVEAEFAQPVRVPPSSLDGCRRCELWRHATQAVGGSGPGDARIMLIGEQPGDQEDLAGQPFVGPAGQLLDIAIARAGLLRAQLYLTNAVKHFKWEPRGKRRLHKTPGQQEIAACAYWLERELRTVRPVVIVALGATALNALLQRKVSLKDYTGAPFEAAGAWAIATWHPSFALRQQSDASRDKLLDEISNALRDARRLAEESVAPVTQPRRESPES
ncbi:UdgX family uracil-DNA binding protein [Paraburkholderia sp. BL21I4N1]|uniref:UdgX family uracil-DNA binding protein n=1 Tax=Paraburkholderia sp. BL21I4N1 TaxID=1938801 RepID=UPI000CFA9B35|nr:UdgX family uracil-DNA binding protein [Paraburkholderia sp. BL21I4N1]PQV46087.1 DNA polymerase [Paraburkholderia sp. BL21I4N1]